MASPSLKKAALSENQTLFLVTLVREEGESGQTINETDESKNHCEIWDSRIPLGIGYPFRWALERTEQGIRVRRLDGPSRKLLSHHVKEVSFSDLKTRPVINLTALAESREGDLATDLFLRLDPVPGIPRAPVPEDKIPRVLLASAEPATIDDPLFRKTLTQVLLGSAVACALLFLLPSKKINQDELIPPQFAKLLLKPALKKEPQQSKKNEIESTRERNVVKAFQSKAVQKTVKQLINMGAVSALSKAALMGGLGSKNALDKVFSQKAKGPALRALDSSILDGSSLALNSLGKAGSYGKTGEIEIRGQGNRRLTIDPGAVQVADGLDKDEVGKAIRHHLGDIRYCYEAALTRNADLEGKLVVTFVIAGDGAVTSAVNKGEGMDSQLTQCIVSHLKRWKFPKPRGGVPVEVSYPFIFKSLGG